MNEVSRPLSIVLAGNPNAGKTTIFNDITGSNQHVGNYPGVTVEMKEGDCFHKGQRIRVIDLPGTYSLTVSSLEERVARDFLINEAPDVVVHVLDASCLERNLYLTVQLLELGENVVIALNMMDVARSKGLAIDIDVLSSLLGVPIIETVGTSGEGLKKLLDQVLESATIEPGKRDRKIRYSADLGKEITLLQKALSGVENKFGKPVHKSLPGTFWVALKLLEQDEVVGRDVSELLHNGSDILALARQSSKRLEELYGDPSEIVIADKRYGFISGACQEAVKLTVESRHRFSDRIDDILAHRILGLPIFFCVVYLIFWITFTFGEAPMGWIEGGVSSFGALVSSFWPKGSESLFRSLLVDGIISGVGGVLIFLPNIVLLFMGISFLEDTGYIARAAFLTDWMMHKIGLHGRSFIPLIIGFGCTVPAIMATRTLENRRDRLTTMLVLPLMSCSARFPIYTLIIPAFFPSSWQAPMLWFIYFLGVVIAVILARLLRSTIFAGSSTPFVMELPIYRLPTLKGVLFHMWLRARGYLEKAGTVILGASIVMWLIQTYPSFPEARVLQKTEITAERARYVSSLEELSVSAGQSARGPLFSLLSCEMELYEASEKFYEADDGYIEVRKKLESLKANLEKSAEGKETLRFIQLRKALLEIDEKYAFLDSGKLGTVASVVRQSELERLKAADPKIYSIAHTFLNETHHSYIGALQRIESRCASMKLDHSCAGHIGSLLEPLLKPIGFDKKMGTALLGAFAAKELFVAQMGIIASVNTEADGVASLRVWLRKNYSPLVGFNILIFCLIATPCMATIAVTRRESGSWKWAALQLGGLTALAWVICLVVYQTFTFFGLLI
jgi:ferrous iron transport protein B